MGEVSLDLWGGALRARGIELSAGERSLLRGGELQARFHTLDCLLGLGIRPSTLELRADDLVLRPEDLQRLAAGGGGTAHLKLALGRVVLDLPAGHALNLARVQLDTTDGTLALRAERASWWRSGEPLGEAAAEFRGSLSAEGAVKGRLRLEGLRSAGHAWVEPLELAVDVDRGRARLDGALSLGSGNGALGFGLALERSSGAQELTLRPGALQLAEALSRLGVAAAGLQARIDGQLVLRRASVDG
ncbi:MAG TPA: hypothetical protein VJV78_09910, partial [Polyangiales bacterium]|nr:hypothetical protein [Polyangiales bacterium]